ncbi:MAG TPA: S8 family serine peptidase [bacterium]|jgi:subtilisin family serine protease
MRILRYIPLIILFIFLWYSPVAGLDQAYEVQVQERSDGWAVQLQGLAYVSDEIIVQIDSLTSFSNLDSLLESGYEVKKILWYRPAFVIGLPSGATIPDSLAKFELLKGVESVSPNLLRHVAFTPDDPLYERQEYHLSNKSEEGWDITTGSSLVKVALIDTGMDITHPEFADRVIWTENFFDPESQGGSSVFDDSGHGTGVAGIIGAIGDNGIGVAGMMWDVRLLAFRACGGQDLQCTIADEVAAIDAAVARGADVINLSLGGIGTNSIETEAIQDAYNAGVVIVAASGNGNPGAEYISTGNTAQDHNTLYYPAGFPEVIGVAALDNANGNKIDPEDLGRAGFSNYGEDIVSVAAVGTTIETTTPFMPKEDVPFAIYQTRNYSRMSGTSFSCPQVTGLAGLILSRFPGLGVPEVRALIEQNAVDLGGPDNDGNSIDDYLGHGLINVAGSVGSGASKKNIFENQWFLAGLAPSSLFSDDFFLVVKCKSGCDQAPNASYFIQETAENASIILEPLPAHPDTYLGRFYTAGSGAITIQITGISGGNPLDLLTFVYTIE